MCYYRACDRPTRIAGACRSLHRMSKSRTPDCIWHKLSFCTRLLGTPEIEGEQVCHYWLVIITGCGATSQPSIGPSINIEHLQTIRTCVPSLHSVTLSSLNSGTGHWAWFPSQKEAFVQSWLLLHCTFSHFEIKRHRLLQHGPSLGLHWVSWRRWHL